MEKWSVELNRFHIEYEPRTAIKAQVLADFLAEFSDELVAAESKQPAPTGGQGEEEKLNTEVSESSEHDDPGIMQASEHIQQLKLNSEPEPESQTWSLHVDGASNAKGAGIGIVLRSPEGLILEQAIRLGFDASNNEAEYEALIGGLKKAKALGVKHLKINCDSQLVANQLTGEYCARNQSMEAYRNLARLLMKSFTSAYVEKFPRANNSHADALATLASAVDSKLKRTVEVEYLGKSSVEVASHQHQALSVDLGTSWMDPIIAYLKHETLPEDSKEAHRVRAQAARYWLSPDDVLYRRSFSGPYLRCVHPAKVQDFLYELHEGSCGSHTGGRSLAHRARSQGYWWPYMQQDALSYVQKCGQCQRFAPIIRQPATDLHPITSPWPFAQWGLDIVGPFPKALNKKFLIVGTDYFTKWVEAEASQKIRDQDVISFLWKNILTRFGIPRALIADNGTQFKSSKTQEFCEGFGIKMYFSTPSYPQSNGQAEASNKVIVDGLKKRLEESKGKWLEELPSVLWTFRTTPRRSTGDSPFALTFGTEAVIPLEVGLPTLRTDLVNVGGNREALEENLDFLEERREAAQLKLSSYHQTLMQQRQKHLHLREFKVGDLVLRKVTLNTTNPADGKLGPNWEGPYVITSVGGTGAYHLEDMEGRAIPNPWNVFNLKKFYH